MAAPENGRERDVEVAQDLSGQVAAITGAASGIGLECARAFLADGARVVLIDRAEERLKDVCSDLGAEAVPLVVDLTDPTSVSSMMPQILANAGRVDMVHANAGSYLGGRVIDGDPDAWDRMRTLIVNATCRSVRAVLAHMVGRKRGDSIMTSAIAGLVPVVWEPVYTA